MKYLLDTCFVSELAKPSPDSGVLVWFESAAPEELYLSVLTLGEIRYGIERLAKGPRKVDLVDWFADLTLAYSNSLFSVDRSVTDLWGRERARLSVIGSTPSVVDALLACSAICNDAILVTRNIRDFEGFEVEILHPWSEGADGMSSPAGE